MSVAGMEDTEGQTREEVGRRLDLLPLRLGGRTFCRMRDRGTAAGSYLNYLQSSAMMRPKDYNSP